MLSLNILSAYHSQIENAPAALPYKDQSSVLLKYKLGRRTLENTYFTFVRPKLEYANIIWDDCTEANKLKLENFNSFLPELVLGPREAQVMLLYNETSWPTLSSRRNNVKMKFMHGVVYGKAPY